MQGINNFKTLEVVSVWIKTRNGSHYIDSFFINRKKTRGRKKAKRVYTRVFWKLEAKQPHFFCSFIQIPEDVK